MKKHSIHLDVFLDRNGIPSSPDNSTNDGGVFFFITILCLILAKILALALTRFRFCSILNS
jgi:hypothetical protein